MSELSFQHNPEGLCRICSVCLINNIKLQFLNTEADGSAITQEELSQEEGQGLHNPLNFQEGQFPSLLGLYCLLSNPVVLPVSCLPCIYLNSGWSVIIHSLPSSFSPTALCPSNFLSVPPFLHLCSHWLDLALTSACIFWSSYLMCLHVCGLSCYTIGRLFITA